MTTPPPLIDRITGLAGSVDLSGFAPFFAPVTFALNENLWPTITLITSLVGILLMTFAIVAWRSGAVANSRTSPLPQRSSSATHSTSGASTFASS
jgi:hypothetical protein